MTDRIIVVNGYYDTIYSNASKESVSQSQVNYSFSNYSNPLGVEVAGASVTGDWLLRRATCKALLHYASVYSC